MEIEGHNVFLLWMNLTRCNVFARFLRHPFLVAFDGPLILSRPMALVNVLVKLRFDDNCSAPPPLQKEVVIPLSADAQTSFTIGRCPSDDDDPTSFITLGGSYCSQRHARIALVETLEPTDTAASIFLTSRKRLREGDTRNLEVIRPQVLLKDLHSTNGTLVNMVRVREAVLRDGDVIVFGGGKDLAVGEAVEDPHSSSLVCWTVHLQFDQRPDMKPLGGPSCSVGEIAGWIAGRSRESLERLRQSHVLPDYLVDGLLKGEEKEVPSRCTTVLLHKGGEEDQLPVASEEAVHSANSSPLLIPMKPTTRESFDIEATPLRQQQPMKDRSASAEPIAPVPHVLPESLAYSAVRVGRAQFFPDQLDPSAASRLLSRLRRKRGAGAGWMLVCNETHVTWSMIDPAAVLRQSSDPSPTTFSVPLTSIAWVGLSTVQGASHLSRAPKDPAKPRKNTKPSNRTAVVPVPLTASSLIAFALKPNMRIPLLPTCEELFTPPLNQDGERDDFFQWVAFHFPVAEEALASWVRSFDASYGTRFQLNAVRKLTEIELQRFCKIE